MKRFFIELYVKLYNRIARKKITFYFIFSERQDKIKYPSYYDLEYPRCKLENGRKYTEARAIENGYPTYKDCKLVYIGTLDDIIWPAQLYGFKKIREVLPDYDLIGSSQYWHRMDFSKGIFKDLGFHETIN